MSATWHAVHLVLQVHPDEPGPAGTLVVFENVHVVRAASDKEARARGDALGREAELGGEGLEWDGRPARLVFAGVRKVVACDPDDVPDGALPEDGAEVTYGIYSFDEAAELEAYLTGAPARLRIED